MSEIKIDMHLHTTHSDGALTPSELVVKAKENGLDAISITDHDNLSGIEEAVLKGKEVGVEVIPGVEISSDIRDKEVHILAYFIESGNEELERYLAFFREERIKRAERMVHKLNSIGIPLKFQDVLDKAKIGAVGRPHIAQALHDKGYVSSYFDAFNKYIGNNCPAFEKKVHISPQSAFKIIADAGGLSFVAHPNNMPEDIFKELIEAGVDGVEVYHPSHYSQHIKFYKGIASEYFLLESGGSDFHGGKREDERNLGKFYIVSSVLEAMRKRLLKKTA